jgi:predicted PurR-regulated permease PerM
MSDPVSAPVVETPAPSPPHERRRRNVGWRSRDVLRTAALIMGLYVALKLLWFANEVFLVAFLGILFGLAVGAGVDRLERFRMPRGMGAALIVLSFFAALYGIGSLVAPTIGYQVQVLKQRLPEAVVRVETWLNTRHGGMFRMLLGPAPPAPSEPTPGPATRSGAPVVAPADTVSKAPSSTLHEGIANRLQGAVKYLFPFISSTFSVLAGLLLIVVMAVYIGADPALYHRGLMHLFPRRSRKRAGDVLSAIASVLRKWLVTQLIAMLVIGAVSTIALLILGVKAAFALGIIAGLTEFIPTIGPVLGAVPAIAMGFLDSPEKALYVTIAYVLIQQLENHILIPLLMKGEMNLPPALTIVTQALMALVFGFLGLLVAVPLLAVAVVTVKMLYVEDVIGEPVVVPDAGGG